MRKFLVLRFEGPLMSFGDVAVDEIRPTAPLPAASMLTGLLGNALGCRYRDFKLLQSIQNRLLFGSRMDKTGVLLRDYQTAELKKDDLLWRTGEWGPSAREGNEKTFIGPTERERYYWADARVTVVVSLNQGPGPSLEDVEASLNRPARPLFLGRASCPPSAPIYRGESLKVEEVRQALSRIHRAVYSKAEEEETVQTACLSEWPAAEGGSLDQPGQWRVIERCDLRDWGNDIHAGSRLVAWGEVRPPVSLTSPGAPIGFELKEVRQ